MSKKPSFLDELLDKASQAAGNDNQLAKRMGVSRQTISNWRAGERPCPPEDVALLAYVAGLDADAWGNRALIAKHEGTAKGELLTQALKKAYVATGGALALCGSTAAEAANHFIRCIFSLGKNYQIERVNSLILFTCI